MGYLLASGILALIFGLLMLAAPVFLGKLGELSNKTILVLNGQLMRYKLWIGLFLLVLGGWMLYVATNYPDPYINAAWIITVAFGLLFLFFPKWLDWLSKVSNTFLLSTDELVMGTRRVIAVVLLVVSFYIFYATLLVR